MIAAYCKRKHPGAGLCPDCRALTDYCIKRLTYCPKGEGKPSCKKCTTHCYAPTQREQVRVVMRYIGPRMLFIDPPAALRHLLGR